MHSAVSFLYLVAIYWVVVFDGIHFSHREGYCESNNCNGDAITNTLLNNACIRCNRSLESERQRSLFLKDVCKETCQAGEQVLLTQFN